MLFFSITSRKLSIPKKCLLTQLLLTSLWSFIGGACKHLRPIMQIICVTPTELFVLQLCKGSHSCNKWAGYSTKQANITRAFFFGVLNICKRWVINQLYTWSKSSLRSNQRSSGLQVVARTKPLSLSSHSEQSPTENRRQRRTLDVYIYIYIYLPWQDCCVQHHVFWVLAICVRSKYETLCRRRSRS